MTQNNIQKPGQDGAIITLHVIPKASKNEVVGWVRGSNGEAALKVKVTQAPEDGKATRAVIELLAGHWGCAKRDLELVSGATSRHKRLKILDPETYRKIISLLS